MHTCGQHNRNVIEGANIFIGNQKTDNTPVIGGFAGGVLTLQPTKEKLYSAYLGNVEIDLSRPINDQGKYYLEAHYKDPKTGKSIMVKVIDAKQYRLSDKSRYSVEQLKRLDPMSLSLVDNKYYYFVTLLSSKMIALLENRHDDVKKINDKLIQFETDANTRERTQKEYPQLLQLSPTKTLQEYKNIYQESVMKNSSVDIIFDVYNYIEFLNQRVGLFGVDNKPHLIAIANIDNLDNAYWTGEYMVFGNGHKAFYPLASLDVCGHEIGHGVVNQLAKLEYKQHSGALNEGFADILGTEFEFWMYEKFNKSDGNPRDDILGKADYYIGEDLAINGKYLRNMIEPEKGMNAQPSQYKGVNYFDPNKQADYGGVHINSGIPNHCYYLLAQSAGREYAFDVFIKCLKKLTKNSTFMDFRDRLKEVSNQDQRVLKCLQQVGLHDSAVSDIGVQPQPQPQPQPRQPQPRQPQPQPRQPQPQPRQRPYPQHRPRHQPRQRPYPQRRPQPRQRPYPQRRTRHQPRQRQYYSDPPSYPLEFDLDTYHFYGDHYTGEN